MGESELVEMISRNQDISPEVVMLYRGIHRWEAVERFLSPEAKKRLEEKGYDFSEGGAGNDRPSRQRRVGVALMNSQLISQVKDDFCRSEEGRLWYNCNVPDINQVAADAYRDAQQYARSIARGAQRTLDTLGRIPNRYVG
jgi:hypothetical protein